MVVCENVETGKSFLAMVDKLCAEFMPDLLTIDPLFAYIGDSVSEQKVVSPFCRNGLNPILQKHRCGLILVHHTNKPKSGKEKADWQAGDYAYLGSGSAELANWARAVLSIQSLGSYHVFQVHLAKRGKRAGLIEANTAEARYAFHIKHDPKGIFWHPATEDDARNATKKPKKAGKATLLALIPEGSEGLARQALINRAADAEIAQRRCCNLIAELIESGEVLHNTKPRATGRPTVFYTKKANDCLD
jgi:hypothetical protein